MRLLRSIILSTALIAAICGVADAAEGNAYPYTVTISTPRETIRPGDEVLIHVVMTNVSDHEIAVDRVPNPSNADCDYRIQVQGKSGLVEYEDGHKCIGPLPLGKDGAYKYLRPGEKLEGDTNLNRILHIDSDGEDLANASRTFDFTSPGEYVIQFFRTDVYGKKTEYVPSNQIAIVVLPGDANAAAADAHPFSIEISTPNETIKAGDAVRIHVVLTNVSDGEITVPASPEPTKAEAYYAIAVSGPKGLFGQPSGYGGSNMRKLKPGETIEEDGVLKGTSFHFSSPGTYTIQFFQKDGGGANPWSVKSNKILVSVVG